MLSTFYVHDQFGSGWYNCLLTMDVYHWAEFNFHFQDIKREKKNQNFLVIPL